jgi:hypothetical protein
VEPPGFPAAELFGHGVRVLTPDDYLCELFDFAAAEILATVLRLAAEEERPPMTARELCERLTKCGVDVFAGRVLRMLPFDA